MVPPLDLWSPLKFFCTNFENFLIMLQIALKPSKTFFFIKTIILNSYKQVSKNFFSNGTPLVLWSPLKLFFDKFWKFLIRLQIALKPSKTFSFLKRIILNSYKMFRRKFFPMVPSLLLWSHLKLF